MTRLHLLYLLVTLSGAWGLGAANASALQIAPSRRAVGRKAPKAFVPYVASQPVTEPDAKITCLLFSIHSSGFDARQYYGNAKAAVLKGRGDLNGTLIVAPQFFEQKAIPGPIPEGMLYWRVSPFRGSSRGAVGPAVAKVGISAFDVMDDWLAELTAPQLFPQLKDIVLVGHSGGGQFVQRYAMVGKFEASRRVKLRFVVSAPSSYAYPSAERFNQRTKRFEKPNKAVVAKCPKYNDWGYGLGSPYGYFSKTNTDEIAKRYATRNVFYLCGSRDADANDRSLGKSCGAMLQGRHRLERMQIFAAYTTHKYGRAGKQSHKFAVVQGMGHYGRGNMNSAAGIQALFSPIR